MEYPNINSLWNYGDPKGSEERFYDLLQTIDKSADLLFYAEVLTQYARSLGLQRKFDEAHIVLDEAEHIINSEPNRAFVRYLLERGRVFNSSKTSGSIPLFEQAYNLATELEEDYYAVDAAHMLGIVEEPDKALTWNIKAVEDAEKSPQKEPKNWLGALYNNIGWTFFSMEKYEIALGYFENDKIWYSERNLRKQELIADWSIAKTKRKLGKTEEALMAQLKIAQIHKQEDMGEDGFNTEEIAECLYELGRAEEARPYFQRAYTLLSQNVWLPHEEPERLERLAKLGNSDSLN